MKTLQERHQLNSPLPSGTKTNAIRYLPKDMDTKEFIDRRLPYTIKAQRYSNKDLGPVDNNTGVPLTFKGQVENQKDWYRQWHKAANRRVSEFSDEDGENDVDDIGKLVTYIFTFFFVIINIFLKLRLEYFVFNLFS